MGSCCIGSQGVNQPFPIASSNLDIPATVPIIIEPVAIVPPHLELAATVPIVIPPEAFFPAIAIEKAYKLFAEGKMMEAIPLFQKNIE